MFKIVLRIYSIYIYIVFIVFIYIVFITTVRESLCLLSIRKCLVLSVVPVHFYMFHRGRVGNVLSIPLYVLTCEEIDNKATLTLIWPHSFSMYCICIVMICSSSSFPAD